MWSPEQYDSGIFFVTATSNEGKVFAKSGGTHFARNHNLINQNYGVYGDVDNNGKINIKDATLVQKSLAHVVELDITSEVLADVNADGKINIKDATTIQKHCAFISVTSRIGEKCTTGIPKYSIKVNQ